MDYYDYREKLGLAFNDSEKQEFFMTKIQVYLQSHDDYELTKEQERDFCYRIGKVCLKDNETEFNVDFLKHEPSGFQRVWLYLKDKKNDFLDFLAAIVVFANTYDGEYEAQEELILTIEESLYDSRLPYDIYTDEDGKFYFPKGAKELDDALVSEPLQWLEDYPKAHATFCRALRQYSNGEHTRDIADNFRKAFEEFLQEYLGNDKNLENNRRVIKDYLKENGIDGDFSNMISTLINTYKEINNKKAKHHDTLDDRLLEFIMYQTGIFIRMLISVR